MARVVENLRSLAVAVEAGEVSDAKRLDEEFARVDHAYAVYYLHAAEAAHSAERWAQAGANLRAAVHRIASGLGWANGPLETPLEIAERAAQLQGAEPQRQPLMNLIEAAKEKLAELRQATASDEQPGE